MKKEEKLEKRIFDRGQHILFKRVNINYQISKQIKGSIETVEGYDVFNIECASRNTFEYVESVSYNIWYINNRKVEVEKVYNDSTGKYDYSDFGKVVEKDNNLYLGKKVKILK